MEYNELGQLVVTEEELENVRKERSDQDKYAMENSAQEIMYQILSSKFPQFNIKDDMYPALWKKLREEVLDVLDKIGIEMNVRCEDAINKVIEAEKTSPIQAPEERPVQSEEDKAKGQIFMDPVEIPESMRTPMNSPNEDNVHINEMFSSDDTPEEIINFAVDKTVESFVMELGDDYNEEKYKIFIDNVLKNEFLLNAVKKCDISLVLINELNTEIAEITDAEFAEKLIWNVFEMPEDLKAMIENFNNSLNGIKQANQVPNEHFLREQLREEDWTEEKIKSCIEELISNNIADEFKDCSEDIITYLQNNNNFVEGFVTEKINAVMYKMLVESIHSIILDKKRSLTEEISQKENLKYNQFAFSVVNAFFAYK